MGFLFGWRASRASKATDIVRRIEDLDLAPILAKARARHSWTDFELQAAADDYRRFLYLLVVMPGEVVVPWTEDLDLIWHEHILDTHRYDDDCRRVLGRFVHHDPHVGRDPAKEAAARNRTADFYDWHFLPWTSDGPSWLDKPRGGMRRGRRRAGSSGDGGVGCGTDGGGGDGGGSDGGGCGGD